MKTHYWIYAKDRARNNNFFIACKQTWRCYNTQYTRKRERVTCEKCKMVIGNKGFV